MLFAFLLWGLAAHTREASCICSTPAGRCILSYPQTQWIQVLVDIVAPNCASMCMQAG